MRDGLRPAAALSEQQSQMGESFKLVHLLGQDTIGRESRALATDHSAVKLWLRLLACSTQIEQEIRTRLRQHFATTLPRFDYLAQLERHPEGLRMNALSRYLMVTGGNVTGLTDQLVADGLVERTPDLEDRRSLIVRLTPTGHRQFLRMALEHERWLIQLFEGFAPREALYQTLGALRVHLARHEEPPPGQAAQSAKTRSAKTRGLARNKKESAG